MNLALSCFLGDWAVRAVLKISAVLPKYPTFEGCRFFDIFMGKKNTKLSQNESQKTCFCVPEHKHSFYSTWVM